MQTAVPNNRIRNRNKHASNTRGGGYSSSNNYRRETPEPEPQSSAAVSGIYKDPRTAMVMCSILGTHTTVKTRNGNVYKGHTTGFSDLGDIAMSDAKLDNHDSQQEQTLSGIIIPRASFVVCKTNGVDIKGLCSGSDFTDSGIVSKVNGTSDIPLRELQPWQDDESVDTTLSLDEKSEGWAPTAMFQTNKDMFDVKSSYNEDLPEYTTRLPNPDSDGYEERMKFAEKHAEEIERSEAYRNRIAKEVSDGDEESRYSAVHRGGESHSSQSHRSQESNQSSGKNTYTIPAHRGEGEQRNGNPPPRAPGRGPPRQNSPYSSASHPQQQQHHMHPAHNSRPPINNHYHQGLLLPQSAPLNRGQGPSLPMHQRQQQQQQQQSSQNHATHPHPYHQQPQHSVMQQQSSMSPVPQQQPQPQQPQQQRPHPQMMPQMPSQQKSQPHHPPVPSSLSQQQPPLPAPQHSSAQKVTSQHSQSIQPSSTLKGGQANMNGVASPQNSTNALRQPMSQVNGDGQQNSTDVNTLGQKAPQMDMGLVAPPVYHGRPDTQHAQSVTSPSTPAPPKGLEASSSGSSSMSESPQAVVGTSPPTGTDRRSSRGPEANPEGPRHKLESQLHDFKRNFVLSKNVKEPHGLDAQESPRAEAAEVSEGGVSATSPLVPAPIINAVLEPTAQPSEAAVTAPAASDSLNKTAEKSEDTDLVKESKLNPNAKEFKPSAIGLAKPPVPVPVPVPVEAQSPSPQQRVSPHFVGPIGGYSNVQYMPMGMATGLVPIPPQRKKATVSVGPGMDLTAHQVTGQPLLATQPHHMFYVSGQHLPAPGYQVLNMGNHQTRMMAPGSLTIGQSGQHANLDQTASQAQPQPVFMTTPQQQVLGPIPAHLTPHPQPAHGQPLPHPSSIQQNPGAHVPNPAPSPVQQHNPQGLPHHMSQGPPQSATPQPSHFPQVGPIQHTIQTVPRTSMSGQQNISGGPSVSMSFPLNMSTPQYSYPNVGGAQYTFAPAPQPQTSQNSSHGPGTQPQFVMMPQPGPQAHPPMQQHAGQQYTTGIQFQAQHNLMQGPPQMPPSHAPAPSQGGPQFIHSGMQGMPTGIPGAQPGMFMPVHQGYQHQQ